MFHENQQDLQLFQAYSLDDRDVPSRLTRNGPSSIIAPYPKEEQPGPAHLNDAIMSHSNININICDNAWTLQNFMMFVTIFTVIKSEKD